MQDLLYCLGLFLGAFMSILPKKITDDFWIVESDRSYAGQHFLVDVVGAKNLDDTDVMEAVFRQAVTVAGANLLHIHMHHFGPGAGVSGVAVLSESHISVHTWPERGFAAFDIFMCGNSQPLLALQVIKQAFPADEFKVSKHLRGEAIYEEIL